MNLYGRPLKSLPTLAEEEQRALLGLDSASSNDELEPEPELSDSDFGEIVPLDVSQINQNPPTAIETLQGNISSGVSNTGRLIGDGISSGLRVGGEIALGGLYTGGRETLGIMGGVASGIGGALIDRAPQLPTSEQVGRLIADTAIDAGTAVGGAMIEGAGNIASNIAQQGIGAVESLLEGDSPESAGEDDEIQPLLENVNPMENLQSFKAEGNDMDGWRPTSYLITDREGVIGKKVKGMNYYVMRKDDPSRARPFYSIVDVKNAGLRDWNSVGQKRFEALVKSGKVIF